MPNQGPRYNLITEFSEFEDTDDISTSPHWVMAVVRLGKPLSYSRKNNASVSLDVTEGAKTRGKTLVITSDCLQMQVRRDKESHVKSLSASLIQTSTNYLVEILPGDWVMAWIVHGEARQQDLIERIRASKACNGFKDGLKFVGRIRNVRKRMSRARASGVKNTRYNIQAVAFSELDSTIFYDQFMAENSIEANNLGRWLSKVGLDIRQVFAINVDEQKDNSHLLIPAFFELLLGTGVGPDLDTTGTKELRQVTGGGITGDENGGAKAAPFAYLVPKEIGDLLGKESRDVSKAGGILAYADIVDLVFGVQKYSNTSPNQYSVFTPDIADSDPLTKGNHFYTGNPLLGSYLPFMPQFSNRPLWSILSEYLNPVINEMYTALRVNAQGDVVPTLIVRQIPFTTDVMADKYEGDNTPPGADKITLTPFTSLPRWVMSGTLVYDIDIGRSDATRCNFVHVFGQDADNAKNIKVTDQLVQNPPIRDDFDIQRSGVHAYMTTVACRTVNQVGATPSVWMELVADHRIGSQYTLNGTLNCVGISAPICEGDNLEFDGVIYHIESVEDSVSIDTDSGMRSWTTSLTLTNGLRQQSDSDDTDSSPFPIYPGFQLEDNTAYDPGHDGKVYAPSDDNADTVDREDDTPAQSPGDDNRSPFNDDDNPDDGTS